MPQFVLVAATGLVAYAAWRLMQREMRRVSVRLSEVRVRNDVDFGTRLVRDADGVYRPER